MKTLIIDTAHRESLIALADGEIVAEFYLDSKAPHSERAAGELENALKSVGWKGADLKRAVVGVGPGSYTGVRVGLALATGLQIATGLEMVGVCSLKGHVPKEDGTFISAFDARAGGVYAIQGEKRGESVVWGKPAQWSIEELEEKIEKVDVCLSPDAERVRERVRGEWKETQANAKQLLVEADESPERGTRALYLRASVRPS